MLRPGDVFLDVGANIGIFTVYAGYRVGTTGKVFAVEPHLPTSVETLKNVAANNLGGVVSVLAVALAKQEGIAPFRYRRWSEGASGSQIGVQGGENIQAPVGEELKSVFSIDTLVERGIVSPPALIKIDTDGVDMLIAEGMTELLKCAHRPRSILIEVQSGTREAQESFMQAHGYEIVTKYYGNKARFLQQSGFDPDTIPFNARFEPTA
ncbi:MAG: FkbM family methyltransferase [Pseudomonadota bacterium]